MATTSMSPTNETPVLRRPGKHGTPWPERPAAFVAEWPEHELGSLLLHAAGMGVRTLYLMGGTTARNTPKRDYWLQPLADGWSLDSLTTWPHSAKYSAMWERQSRPVRVDVHMSAAWFDSEPSAGVARDAYNELADMLRQFFDRNAHPMGTPSRTGLDLFQRVLPEHGRYPVLPAHMRLILHDHIGQGRQHVSPAAAAGTTAESLYWLDGRFMYAHSMRNLPTGTPHLVTDWINKRSQDVDKYAPAFYCVSFRVPHDWRYDFGLLPVRQTDAEAPTIWPHEPGSAWVGWCSGAELALAREQGWHTVIREGIVFSGGEPDPGRPFIERMRAIRAQAANPLVYAAARNITIGAVGAFARQARAERRSIPYADRASLPPDAYHISPDGDRIDYRVDVPLHASLQPFQHIEWSGTVWGRCRSHVARAALRYLHDVPGGRILLWRNDGFVVDKRPPWVDDMAVGTFRVKREVHAAGHPLDVPRNEDEYRALLRRLAESEA